MSGIVQLRVFSTLFVAEGDLLERFDDPVPVKHVAHRDIVPYAAEDVQPEKLGCVDRGIVYPLDGSLYVAYRLCIRYESIETTADRSKVSIGLHIHTDSSSDTPVDH